MRDAMLGVCVHVITLVRHVCVYADVIGMMSKTTISLFPKHALEVTFLLQDERLIQASCVLTIKQVP
jgi:hypothetical protein